MTDESKRDDAEKPGEPAPESTRPATEPPVAPGTEEEASRAANDESPAEPKDAQPTKSADVEEPAESEDASSATSKPEEPAKSKSEERAKSKPEEPAKSKSDAKDEGGAEAGSKAAKAKKEDGATKDDEAEAKRDPARFFLSFAVLLLALGAGEMAYRRSTLPQAVFITETYPVKMADYTKRGGADVVIVGSSRIYHGANTPLLSRLASEAMGEPITVYNMGIPSGDVPGYVLTANDVLRKGLKRPRLFVFAMSPIEWMCCPATSVPSSPRWIGSVRMRHAWALMSSATDPDEAFTDLTIGLFQSYGARTHVINQVLKNQPPPAWRGDAGQLGWVSFGWPVDAATQNVRGNGRANGYAPYFFPPMHFDRGATHRYFQTAMGWLESAGVKVAIIGTAQARQLDRNHLPPSYYPDYVEYLTEQAKLHDTVFVNFNDFPGLQNGDFADGDHLAEPGSVKFSRVLSEHVIVPMLKGQKPTAP